MSGSSSLAIAETAQASELGAWMAQMETSITAKSSAERVTALRGITSLFVSQSPALPEEGVALFDDVLVRLLEEVGQAAQEELSERIASLPNAPMQTIRTLAHGPIEVARPVLMQSSRISDAELADIVRSHGDQHRLAITRRRLLSPVVTDALVAEGGQDVLRAVARNSGAEFSEQGMSSLVAKAAQDEVLQVAIGRRADVPEQHLDALLARASDRVRDSIMPHLSDAQRAAMAAVLARAAQTVASTYRRQQIDYAEAKAAVEGTQTGGGLTEERVAAFAREGRTGPVILALATLTRLPVPVIESVMLGDKTESVLIVCRSLDFRWTTTRPVVMLGRGSLGEAAIENLASAYGRMSHATAGRIVRFLAVQQAASRET